MGVFAVVTSHGTVLAIDAATGRLCHVASNAPSNAVPAMLLASDAGDGYALLFGLDPASRRPVLPREVAPGTGRLFRPSRTNGAITLRSALSQRFLSAIPGGGIEANRIQAAPWEHVQLSPVTLPGLEPWLAEVGAVLARPPAPLQAVTALLAGPPSLAAAVLIEAMWPLLTLEEFDGLARRLEGDAALAQRVAAFFPADFYAATALPALQAWLAARTGDPAPAPSPSPGPAAAQTPWSTPWRWRDAGRADPAPPGLIGPDRDHLARDGYDGWLSSFAHACNAALRRRVTPTKGVAIVATARSEGVYLLEWIAYYRQLGVEAIFLYTNNNDDGSDALLGALHAAGVITWTRSEMAPGCSAQNKAYGHALNVSLPLLDHRWALFIDMDEFLVLNPDRYRTLADFARWHEMRETDAVGMNWVMVGSSGQLRWTNAPLTRRNTHLLTESNAHIKVMLAPRHFIQAHPHFPFADYRRPYVFRLASGAPHESRKQPAGNYHARAFTDEPSCEHACIYHYNFKSVEELAWKLSRNRGDYPVSHATDFGGLNEVAVNSFVDQHNTRAYTTDDRISRYTTGLDAELARLRFLPGVADAEQAMIARFKAGLRVA